MILGLSGKKGSGKDAAYKFIAEWAHEHEIEVRRDAFADRLKLSAARIFFPTIALDEAILWCNGLKERSVIQVRLPSDTVTTISGREFLQHYGTEAHRDVFGQDFWLDLVANEYLEYDELVVVTDVRFDNEAKLVHDLGGEVWEIQRPSMDDGDTHASEVPVDPDLVDRIIHNDRDLARFRSRVRLQVERVNL